MTFLNAYFRRLPYAHVVAMPVVLALSAGCGDGGAAGAAPGGPGGEPMSMGVEAVALAARPVERSSEYIATVKSRRSTTLQPQVDGYITEITARAGQRVARGAPLMEIDSARQQATVANLESVRAARQAELQWAQQQAERNKKLFDAGAISQQEYEQTATGVQTTQAQLNAVEAQIREQQVELAYHRVIAPTSGIVGDIPVRVGDRVTSQTVLTTIDENAGLELYINVPVAQATALKPGLLVRVVDDSGRIVATSAVSFISPSVDTATQSVLVKAPLSNDTRLRIDQFMRTHLVWTNDPSLTVPVVAALRINGQHFVYVAEKDEAGLTVARQRAVVLGPVVGNDYVVLSGLKAGEQLIVSGIQKIGDGMPVTVTAPGSGAAPARHRRRKAGRARDDQPPVHPAPDSRDRLLAADYSRWRHRDSEPADRAVSGAGAAVGDRHRVLHRGQCTGGRERRHHAARAGDQWRRGHDLHDLVQHQQRRRDDHHHVRCRPQSRSRGDRRAESGEPGARPHAGRCPHHRHHRHQEHDRVSRRPGLLFGEQPLQRAVHQQLRRRVCERRAQARSRSWQHHSVRRAQVRDAPLARSGQARRRAN